LRECRRQQADDRELSGFKVREELDEALAAIELNDRQKATAIWTRLRNRYPTEVRGWPSALDVLLKLGRFSEAELLMREGQKRYPREVHFASGLGATAHARGDHDQAVEFYAALRKQFPGAIEGYALAAQSLAAAGRLEEAEALAKQAMGRFPGDIRGFLEYARLATRRDDLNEALKRWLVVRDAFGGHGFGHLGAAEAMMRLGRYDEAEAVLSSARVRLPTESHIFAALARCAEARGDTRAAVARWKQRVERFPLEMIGYSDAASALERLGDVSEAEAILRAGVDRFADEKRLAAELERLLRRRTARNAEGRTQMPHLES
jgi:tetratricopeptide (TPR) repeat protein